MKQKNSFMYIYIVFIIIFNKIQICFCQSNDENFNNDNIGKFVLELYDLDDSLISKYNLHYNYTTYYFNEYDELKLLANIKYGIICSEDDINKERETLIFWNISTYSQFTGSAIILNVFPIWYNQQKKNNKYFCMRFDSVGWYDNGYADICDDEHKYPCPDIIVLGTTQLARRYHNNETINLNKYIRNYLKKTGISFESKFTKYAYYDYNVNNNWLAVPLAIDFRIFKFNSTTFDHCINNRYDLKYPPPRSNSWERNYKETWTWEKVLEYSKIITECTGYPGLKLLNNYYEDMNFLINFCQSLNIPFFTEDSDLNIKKCGLRKPEYIKKLSILKELVGNHYVEKWFNETDIENWMNSPYPDSFKDLKKITYNDTTILDDSFINGLYYANLYSFTHADEIKYSYYPGSSSLLGSGLVITKKSKYPDELFEFFEILIDEKYPVYSGINPSVTPIDNIYGNECMNINVDKKENCNSLLGNDGIFPYYYINNNTTEIVYLKHISIESDRGISIDHYNISNSLNSELFSNIQNFNFKCDNHLSFEYKTIIINSKFKIEIPINSKEKLILKSMADVEKGNIEHDNELKCEIYSHTFKTAKPISFPYNNFMEIKNLEIQSPTTLFFAHLYYNYYRTYKKEKATFEDLIDEFCDIVDDALLPYCENTKNINFTLGNCNDATQKMPITFLNCKVENNGSFQNSISCPYLPNRNYKGIIIESSGLIFLIIELILIILVIFYQKERCINVSGLKFLIMLIISCILINLSTFFWIGKFKTYKCIAKIWLMILGITGYIISYSIKSRIIVMVYRNKNFKTFNFKKKVYLSYGFFFMFQIILLTLWTFTQKGIESADMYIRNVGYIKYAKCSTKNIELIDFMFFIDYVLLLLSIRISYLGRNIPDEFNDSKKIHITSLISIFQLISCNLAVNFSIDNTIIFALIIFFMGLISFININIFITPKILVALDLINNMSQQTSVLIVNNSNTNFNQQ